VIFDWLRREALFITRGMKYSGREFGDKEIAWIDKEIAENPGINRVQLSRRFCEWKNWRKPDGGLKEMSCRVAMLRLHREGFIELPAPQSTNGNRSKLRISSFQCQLPGFENQEIMEGSVGSYQIAMHPVASPGQARLWNEYMSRHHYLGYVRISGAQIRYTIEIGGQPVGLLGFGAAAWKVGSRDRDIGWDHQTREKRLHLIANNQRFLILPWVRIRYLASKILSLVEKRIGNDWQERYGYKPVLLETFVQKDRFRGSSYAAANWKCVGQTQGRGKYDRHTERKEPIKTVWIRPLAKDYRQRLCGPES
jgi:hypothetical protein